MILLDRNNQEVEVLSQFLIPNRLDTVYNIEVDDFHTYHVGRLGVWVHNADCCTPSGWINRDIWNKLSPDIQKKFNNAIAKGIVAPTGQQGVIVLSKTEPLARQGYTHKLKILGKGGDIRIYGKQQPNGHIIYDKIEGH